MKIARIELKDFNQFKHVTLDLTYPRGHEKAGEPLDKVCIIGQSGTGKTSLLRLIKWFVSRDNNISENVRLSVPTGGRVDMDFNVSDLHYRLFNNETNLEYDASLNAALQEINPLLINYPVELNQKRNLTGQQEISPFVNEDELKELKPQQIIDFAFEDIKKTWDFILKDIIEHRANALFMKSKIADSVRKNGSALQEIQEASGEYDKWLSHNPDPLKVLADKCLDPILDRLGLKVNLDISRKSIRELGFIELISKDGKDVPEDFWSTGTWQLVQTIIPLYQLRPANAVILMDEPERSLYPDYQTTIIDTYINLAPGSQFFFATHSPMIASCFEPWEVIELKFDPETRFVFQDLHYEGENHVDNYKYDPQYLRWDSNLLRIFGLEKEGGKKRREALRLLAELNVRIRKLKAENKLESEEGQRLVDENLKIKEQLDWRLDK
ncbi:MAG TPA: ATP-binding protein [Candidatus Kapabacteria bacterium]|nr:ATP-binding protein [Candidatus Kapabacteria bacterium]